MIPKIKTSPFLQPLLATAVGIWLHAIFSFSFITLICCVFISGLLATISLTKKYLPINTQLCIILFFSCTGALVVTIQKKRADWYQEIICNKPINIQATIIDKDVWGTHQQSDVLRISASSIHFKTTKQITPVSFDLLCYLPYHTPLEIGDVISVNDVTIKPFNQPSQSGNPSYNDYLVKENVLCSLFFHNSKQCLLIQKPSWSISRWLWNMRNNSYNAIKARLAPAAFRLVGLIFFGNKQQKEITELRSRFNFWGLAHFLARAGLHIVFLSLSGLPF